MPCLAQGNELLLIGDSYIDTPVYLTPVLEADATMDMQLPAGQHYNVQAVAGTQSPQIKQQWEANKSPAPIFVVMDGGGNDVLIGAPQCLSAAVDDPTCDGIADMANATIKSIWTEMKAAGVKGVVYFFYPHIPLAAGGGVVDYSLPKARESCDSMNDDTFKCVFVDTQPTLDNHPEYYGDGIHPSMQGGPQALAGVVWKAMKDNCIGQTSGCCGN
jgi:lysophospholipase L1-like esterase